MSSRQRRRCRYPGCEEQLGRRNKTGLCGRHYLSLSIEQKGSLALQLLEELQDARYRQT